MKTHYEDEDGQSMEESGERFPIKDVDDSIEEGIISGSEAKQSDDVFEQGQGSARPNLKVPNMMSPESSKEDQPTRFRFNLKSDQHKEIDKKIKVDSSILRHLTVKYSKLDMEKEFFRKEK